MKIGIVGHGADKFTIESVLWAKEQIKQIMIKNPDAIFVSGHSPVGGIDIWVEDIAKDLGMETDIKSPTDHSWDGSYGFKARNIDIAKSDVVYVILVDQYPLNYMGRRFIDCYHCLRHGKHQRHVKSGGCWTGWKAIELGNKAEWIIYGE